MKTLSLLITLLFVSSIAQAQFRAEQPSALRYTGSVIKPANEPVRPPMFGMANMEMRHSYEMTFMNAGGQSGNLNMYTNTMMFQFNPKLTARVDVSMAHSPMGNNMMMGNNGGPQIFLRNAELNYQISDKSFLSVSFQQIPGGFMGPFDPMWGGYGRGSRLQNRYSPFGIF